MVTEYPRFTIHNIASAVVASRSDTVEVYAGMIEVATSRSSDDDTAIVQSSTLTAVIKRRPTMTAADFVVQIARSYLTLPA